MLLAFHGKHLWTLTDTSVHKRENHQRSAGRHFANFEGCPKTLLQPKHQEGRAQDTAQQRPDAHRSFPSLKRQGSRQDCPAPWVHKHYPGSAHRRHWSGAAPRAAPTWVWATWVWAQQASPSVQQRCCVSCSEHCVFVSFQVEETMVKLFFWELFCEKCTGLALNSLCSVDQAGPELQNLPASASQVWGLKAGATIPNL